MRVFVIHGMGRTPLSMWLLARRLRGAGHRTTLFGYLVTAEELERITDRFVDRVRSVMEAEATAAGEPVPYAVVGHSLGNVIARLASPRLPPGLRRLAMLAPPNRPPAIAKALADNPIFQTLTRDAGRKLTDEEFFAALPMPETPALIVAGTRGPRADWLPFDGERNDAILKLEETLLDGVPTVEVPGTHTFLMFRRDVFEIVRDFLADAGDGDEGGGEGGGEAAA